MFLVILLVAIGILALRFTGASGRAQTLFVVLVFALVLAVQIFLPQGHSIRMATGGSLRNWLILGGGMAVVFAYTKGLRHLKSNAPQPVVSAKSASTAQPKSDTLSSQELDRYARHIVLREIGGPGQQKLRKARVLVIGAGGLGSPVLMYLAAAGVGTIGVIDDDDVSLSNLQRQVLFDTEQQDLPKVLAAKQRLGDINPEVEIVPHMLRLTEKNGADLVSQYDLVLDGSDNFATRYTINALCVAQKTPLISGAISQWEGQISLFDPAKGTPCYACIFPASPADGLAPSCAEAGVVGALPGVIGAMMAMEAIKHITGAGTTLSGEMLIYDGLYGESRKMKLQPTSGCLVCGAT